MAQRHTDNEFLLAIRVRSVNPWLPVGEISEELKEDERYTRDRLLKLEADGKLESKKLGNTLFFRPK